MKKTFLLGLLIGIVNIAFTQPCNVDFNFTVNSNNFVTFTNNSSSPCQSPPIGWGLFLDYGDTISGEFNTWGGEYNTWGFDGHFYKYPGVYSVCGIAWMNDGICVCEDSVCHQITISDTGSYCQASYCYNATVDTSGYLHVEFYNTSQSYDSITNVFWVFNDGTESQNFNTEHNFFYPVTYDQLTYLYIQTQNGCQSVIVDTLTLGLHCDSVIGVKEIVSKTLVNVYPTIVQSKVTIETSNFSENMVFELFNLEGKKLRSVKINSKKIYFEKNNLESGVYVYKVFNEYSVFKTGRLIFQ